MAQLNHQVFSDNLKAFKLKDLEGLTQTVMKASRTLMNPNFYLFLCRKKNIIYWMLAVTEFESSILMHLFSCLEALENGLYFCCCSFNSRIIEVDS